MNALDIAFQAVRLYAETHHRPAWVTQSQAAEILGKSKPTIKKWIDQGKIKRNSMGMIPIA